MLAFVGAASLAAISAASALTQTMEGEFALQGATVKTRAYLQATPSAAGTWNFSFWMTQNGGSAPLTAYNLDMTKLMHVIVISDDFTTFLHEHPAFSAGGHFTMGQSFPQPGTYHVYFDGRPTGYGQQVFRFDINAGTTSGRPRDLRERSSLARVDGYSVALSGLSLQSGSEASLAVHITKNGRPAADLHPYLQALAHAILIDAADLTYVHVHPISLPGDTNAMSRAGVMVYSNDAAVISPNMLIHVTVYEPGTYKLWFQFRGGSSLHIASFVLTAS